MLRPNDIEIRRAAAKSDRDVVLDVLRTIYVSEKGWTRDVETLFPASDLSVSNIVWFIVRAAGHPGGVLRVVFDPPLAAYAAYGLELLDARLNVDEFLKHNRVAEIGRFAIDPRERGSLLLPAALMRAATLETIRRGYTHFVTDVLEDDPHNPYGFHTRVLGFEPVATHRTGELLSSSRRITLVLDIAAAYHRLRARNNWIFRYMTQGWEDQLRAGMAA